MRKYLITLVPVLMLSLQQESRTAPASVSQQPAVWAPSGDDLKPTVTQERVEQAVTQLLTRYHYRKVRLSDSLSAVVWNNYLKEMDPSKVYFLASDVTSFEKYKNQIDDALVNGDLTAAFDMYNVFRKRFNERNEFVKQTLSKPFSFTTDESYNVDREKAQWPKSADEQNDIWRKMLKNQALELKLAGKADTSVATLMNSRYKNLAKNLGRIKSEDVFQWYMNAFGETLDPHTNYLSPRTADSFNEEMSASLEGIGARLQADGEYIKITDLVPGGPALRSKQFTAGDKIIGVAQGETGPVVSVVGMEVDEAVKLIKGPKGTVVRLQIKSPSALATDVPKEIRIVREKIRIAEARAHKEVIDVTEEGHTYKFGVVVLPIFYRDFEGARRRESDVASTTTDVKNLIDSLKMQKVDGIVIDLRGNGGGSLIEAINLTGLFIQKGPVVQVKDSGGETEVMADNDPSVAYDGPLAVLVDRFSASASEIFAAAIQDYHRGIIVGGQTFGKGTVQQLIDLNNMLPKEQDKVGQVKMTTQKFYRINGSSTQHKGVTPDIQFPSRYSAEDFGESSQPSALPWDQIASARFDATSFITDKLTTSLRAKYEQRLKTDADLKREAQAVNEFKKAKENTTVSLQESKRKKEKEEAEKKVANLEKPASVDSPDAPDAAKTKKKKDTYLTETGRVLADMITQGGQNKTKLSSNN
ncbi:carboxy terminal-processing peptidase [uncultured Fibrella sp.]|uniref:carboxy terminal-processing peptidase n=1 Tax=uncultured Fibrella sp. TaxID=1284596 RepID=UPI0035C9F50A